jgi:hypothetical protein
VTPASAARQDDDTCWREAARLRREHRGWIVIWLAPEKARAAFSNSNCVEVAQLPDGQIGVRDSKSPHGPVLQFTPGEWNAFTAGVRNGEFDNPAAP